ncbi:MAG: dockerin type I repeat-containing protein [Ruminococcus sp.]|nr:dockerin type I repeat-containing protein [Ruminococcus sp.]
MGSGRTKMLAALSAAALMLNAVSLTQNVQDSNIITADAASFTTGSRIRVDINKNDGRKASYSKNANNWLLAEGSTAEYSVGNVNFRLSNGGSAGSNVTGANNKKLQLQSGIYPRLTMDGAKIKDGDNGGVLKLEISGLTDGEHSLQMWHCNTDGYTNSKLSISVNGKKVLTGVECPTNVNDENDAGISYVTWSGSSVTILITPEGGGRQDVAWLNGFELDGSDPVNGVSKMYPADQEAHLDIADGLSWNAGKNAQSHDVYIGTSYDSVFSADRNSPEFKGNQTGTKYALDDTYSSIPTYYWRVDEVNANGTVKGTVYSFQINRLSFPTAEGYGRFARGGRGGYVYHVTNLNDSGEGSLRYGLETLKGARTIVFDVGGVIPLESVLCIPEDGGDVYVAGQTAPGDGITLINYTFGAMGSSDVIIRDIRTRVGDVSGKSMGGMGMSSCDNSIVDHCSISWATDEGFSSRSAANLTFQWNIIGESLNNSVHYDANDRSNVERHAFAASIGGYTGSFHHNLLIDNTGRNWSLAGAMEQDGVTYGGQLDIRNNVVYNWRDRTTDGGARRVQFVNNYYKAGSVSNTSLHLVSVDGNELNTGDMQKLYASGNVKAAQNGSILIDAGADEWSSGKAKSGGKNSTSNDVKSDKPFFESYVITETADSAYKSVIAGAGANYPQWDYIDSRYINEVKNGTYTYTGSRDGLKGIIDSQNDVGGYPSAKNFKGGTAPIDTDGDGMPDAWESEHGLNPNDAKDSAIVSLSADDYTNLEMYLNELAGDPVEFNGTVTREPITGKLISSVEVLDTTYYSAWAVDTSLEVGDTVFGDRTADRCAISELPAKLKGAEIVLTPCDAKASSQTQAELTAEEDITLYVGLDSRVEKVPEWLNCAVKTGAVVRTTNDVLFELYSLPLKAGEKFTLGANGQSAYCMNYIIIASNTDELTVRGDVNTDGEFSIADLVLLQRWLLSKPDSELADWKAGDLSENDRLDVFDLVILRRELFEKN